MFFIRNAAGVRRETRATSAQLPPTSGARSAPKISARGVELAQNLREKRRRFLQIFKIFGPRRENLTRARASMRFAKFLTLAQRSLESPSHSAQKNARGRHQKCEKISAKSREFDAQILISN